MTSYRGDIHADVPENAETVAARINELHEAIQLVESCGAHPLLTDAVGKLGKRMGNLRRIAPDCIHYDSWDTERGTDDGHQGSETD